MVLTGTCLYLLTAPGFVHVCFMSAFYAFQALRVIWMCLHGKRHSKTLSPLSHKPSGKTLVRSSYVSWVFLEMKVVIFNRRGTHTQTPFITEIHIIYVFIFQYSALTLLMTDSVLSKKDISVSGLMFCQTIFQLLFAGGGVYLSLKNLKKEFCLIQERQHA